MWRDLKRLSPSVQPGGYTMRYPAQLLEKVAQCVYQEGCAGLGFQRFFQYKLGSIIVGGAIAQAWKAFEADPAGFPAYEAAAIQALRGTNR